MMAPSAMYEAEGNWIHFSGLARLVKSARIPASSERLVEGVACTPTEDLHGERVEPMGLDLTYFAKHGKINWDHSKGPSAIIGEPVDWRQDRKRLWLQSRLYEGIPRADETYDLLKAGATLAYSVEGKVIERDPKDRNRVLKALVVNTAITPNPVNPDTICALANPLNKALTGDDLASGMVAGDSGVAAIAGAESNVLTNHLHKSRQACGCIEGSGEGTRFRRGYEGAIAHFSRCCGASPELALALSRNHEGVARATGHQLAKGA